jgi:Saxitoxin biosynthesis operon protein SxtJ
LAHEDLTREEIVESSSDRSFGFVFAAVFLVIAAWPAGSGQTPRWWAFAVASAFALLAWVKPNWLGFANKQWTQLGVLLGKIVSPIALGVVFYAVITPIGALMRLVGSDPLRLRRDQSADTYWIRRTPPGPPRDSLNKPF